jgi:hypothetical protein
MRMRRMQAWGKRQGRMRGRSTSCDSCAILPKIVLRVNARTGTTGAGGEDHTWEFCLADVDNEAK